MKTTLRKITGASPLAVWLALSCLQSSIAEPGQGTPASKPAKTAEAIPWSQIGAKAGADYKGDGLAVIPTADGARLRCVFQRLEGEATCEGLWLTSGVTNNVNDRFRIVAAAVGREGGSVERVASERQRAEPFAYAPRSTSPAHRHGGRGGKARPL